MKTLKDIFYQKINIIYMHIIQIFIKIIFFMLDEFSCKITYEDFYNFKII